MYNYLERSQDILVRLYSLELTPDRLMKIGAFIVAYGLFETGLERALWALTETDVRGQRPFTEKMSATDQFTKLGEGHASLSEKCNAVLKMAASAADDLCNYRNSLVHGYLIAIGGPPSFLRNPAWDGERRNKAVGDAYLHEPMQDLALVAAWTLSSIVRSAAKALTDPEAQRAIEGLEADVQQARSYANELRHLRALMNHEKY